MRPLRVASWAVGKGCRPLEEGKGWAERRRSVPLEENKALARRYLEGVWNEGNLALIDELLTPKYVFYDPASPGPMDREGFKQFVRMYRSAFPDAQYTIEDLIAEGDEVAVRYTGGGTHQGELLGIPATGKSVTMNGIDIVRITGSKIEEERINYDALGLLQQLGPF
jgi:steroid delta-isomerase-like uncharacterized protein